MDRRSESCHLEDSELSHGRPIGERTDRLPKGLPPGDGGFRGFETLPNGRAVCPHRADSQVVPGGLYEPTGSLSEATLRGPLRVQADRLRRRNQRNGHVTRLRERLRLHLARRTPAPHRAVYRGLQNARRDVEQPRSFPARMIPVPCPLSPVPYSKMCPSLSFLVRR